jgi:hypothetical protein
MSYSHDARVLMALNRRQGQNRMGWVMPLYGLR